MSWNENKLICDRCEIEIESKQIRKEKKNSKFSICLNCYDKLEEKRRNMLIEDNKVDFIDSSTKSDDQ